MAVSDLSDELYHYGVLGMKWGVQKDPAKAHAKASRKLRKIDAKAAKTRVKADKWVSKEEKATWKANLAWTKGGRRKGARRLQRIQGNIAKYNYKADKIQLKGRKWYSEMERMFADYDTSSFNADDVALGNQYAKYIFQYTKQRARS